MDADLRRMTLGMEPRGSTLMRPGITRQNGKGDVVMLSAEEFAGWQETVRLLSSPRNAERLMRSIRQLESGNGEFRELIEDDQTAA